MHSSEISRAEWLGARQETLGCEQRGALGSQRRWSWARLATFAAAATAWYPFRDWPWLSLLATAILIGVFALTVGRHHVAVNRRRLADRILLVLGESMRRCGGVVALIRSHHRPQDASDSAGRVDPIVADGPTWELTGQERDDLDFYSAPVGLFGLLNRTSTIFGSRRLRDMVENPCLSAERVLGRRTAVRWLELNPAFRLRIMGACAILRDRDALLERLARALRGASPIQRPVLHMCLRVWSVVTLVIVLLALARIAQGWLGWTYLLVGIMLLNGTIYLRMGRMLSEHLSPWKSVQVAAEGVKHAAGHAAELLPGEPADSDLARLRERFAIASEKEALPSLSRRVAWADSGGMIHAFLNALLFYDLHVVSSILHCVLPNRRALLESLAALADLEALTSLACFSYESGGGEAACYAELVESPTVAIKSGGHPLISPDCCVRNDVRLDSNTRAWVVTGSNMAGKSTLLRMCGVNCVLAQLGTVAIAEEMTLSPLRLITDLQTRDNLAGDESYFLAEVRHVRRMVDPEPNEAPVLGLMDEPFRGTNSIERIAAATAVAEHVLSSGNLILIATHEQSLTELPVRYEAAENVHFEENLADDGLVFDYRVHPGAATTRNALRVLEQEGYPKELLKRAGDYATEETDS